MTGPPGPESAGDDAGPARAGEEARAEEDAAAGEAADEAVAGDAATGQGPDAGGAGGPASGPDAPQFTAAVLCGGASRRMGRDKALIEVAGRALALRVADALHEAGAGEVVAVGGDRAALTALGLPFVADQPPGLGPVGGIVSALRGAVGDIVLVVGCDLLDPSPAAMAATVGALAADPAADVAVPVVSGERQWVHAAWRRARLVALSRQLQRGERAVHRAVERAGLTVIDVFGLDPSALADADTPDDLPSP